MERPKLEYRISASARAEQYLHCGLKLWNSFDSNILELAFPRWIPGSYFIREPMQYVSEISALSEDGMTLKCVRSGVDKVIISGVKGLDFIDISWEIICREMTVRSTHLDNSHLHMMPPFTFMLPTRGIDQSWKDNSIYFNASLPKEWEAVTQMNLIEIKENGNHKEWSYVSENRDRFLDSILEANSSKSISWKVDGRNHILKLWDSGGYQFDKDMVNKFVDDATKIIKEHNALFGIPDWNEYVTVLHFTNSSRGGLEHEDSQTSMMPRKSLMKGNKSEYLDLISLFSHEYLHQWNVKRLRPKNFLDYDLQKEVNSDLLWWFEGGTSWMGDIICLRSGAWDEEQYRKDFTRKYKRHLSRNGSNYESLAESSHDAWIHLYRRHEFSSERQINYYLEGELAIFVLDSEMRKRTKGKIGVDDLMSSLYRKYTIESKDPKQRGINRKIIRKELTSFQGCSRLGKLLDDLMYKRGSPDILSAMENFGIKLEADKKKEDSILDEKSGWIGINISIKDNQVKVLSHLANSPSRSILMPGDEIIHVDGLRVTNKQSLGLSLKGKMDGNLLIGISREGVYREVECKCVPAPVIAAKMTGKGNAKWQYVIASKQVN